jgi:hypothetical protein
MKKILTLVITTCSVIVANSGFGQITQVWGANYQHTNTPGYSNEGRRIAEDPSGNIFMLMDATSDLDPAGIQSASTFHYVILLKYSTTGSLVDKLYLDIEDHVTAGFNNSSAFGIEIDAAGNIYLGYSTWDAVNGFDVVLAKYDNGLSNLWTNTYSLPGAETGVDMKLHPSGVLYAIAKSVDLNTTYSLIKSVPSNSPALVVHSFPAGLAAINALDLDGAQTAYVAGYTIKGGYKNALVSSINLSTNSVNWGATYTNPALAGDDVANKITVGIDGSIYTVGTSYQGSLAGDQVLITRNLPGNAHFDFIVLLKGTEPDERGLLVNADESGWVYIGAASATLATVYRIPDNGIFSTPGAISFAPQPVAAYNSITGVTLNDMKVSPSKNVYVTGGVLASGPSGNFSASYFYKCGVVFGNALVKLEAMDVEGDSGHNLEGVSISLDFSKSDVFLLRNFWDDSHSNEAIELYDLNVPSPLRFGIDAGAGAVSLYPNPATEMVMVRSADNITKLEVTDAAGKIVIDADGLQGKEAMLNTSSLAAGLYMCKVLTESSQSVIKLVVN